MDFAVAQDLQTESRTRLPRLTPWLVSLGLALFTACAFLPALHADFINFDDFAYVTANDDVKLGLTLDNVQWAMTHRVLDLYHPLSILSFMIDHDLFGDAPAGYHAENVLIHVGSVLVLFTFLRFTTGSVWRSAAVAAVFGVHPLRVESVVWVAERKDVLAVFFGLLSLRAYAWYARKPSMGRMLTCAVAFTLSLLAKPLLVTLPVLLLVIDFWPLRRTHVTRSPPRTYTFLRQAAWALVLEKALLFALSTASIYLTVADIWSTAPTISNPARGIESVAPLPAAAVDYKLFLDDKWRKRNAVVSYVRYLYKMVDVSHLAAFYPPTRWTGGQVAGSGLLLILITLGVLAGLGTRPWLAVGWFWFLGTLVPVIGVVMVSAYSLADRYTYFPMIGILIMVVWSIPDKWHFTRARRTILACVTTGILAMLFAGAFVQSTYWLSSESLWEHAIQVTDANYVAHDLLGSALAFSSRHKDLPRAVSEFRLTQKFEPDNDHAFHMEAIAQNAMGHTDDAITAYQNAVARNPQNAVAAESVALLFNQKKQYANALKYANIALATDPGDFRAMVTRSITLTELDRLPEAMKACGSALEISPRSPELHNQLGIVLLKMGHTHEATSQFELALSLKPDYAEAKANLQNMQMKTSGSRPEPQSP